MREGAWASLLSMGCWNSCRREKRQAPDHRAEHSGLVCKFSLRRGTGSVPTCQVHYVATGSGFETWLWLGIRKDTAVVIKSVTAGRRNMMPQDSLEV